ncbi:beta-lactamase family protein [Ruania sp. N2-46]|uniref:Beta-lactamase family protein n=1 Tax=Occultella gossypii TaxID=2800820 RepID=A0ABS7SC72_9MICO|nr:beta-lactamase family protein [Occultella gossypii]
MASRGADLHADYEIASVSKGITGLLYADGMDRGEVRRDATLGSLLPLGGTPAADVTLAAVSTHRSGLPGLPRSAHPWRRTITLWRHGTNPYGETLAQLLDQARGVRVGRPRVRYSNFGFELLGHAVANAAGMTFADLVRERLARPLGLDRVYVPATTGQLRPGALTGATVRGRPRQPWTGEALGPAGGIRSCIGDLARLAVALLAGSAPGIAALDPVAPLGMGARIGAGWVTTPVDGRPITWHNGGSGGFRSWFGLDRSAGTAAVILTATAASVDRPGFTLLAEQSGPVSG